MTHRHPSRSRTSSLTRSVVAALLVSAVPAATAFAQSGPRVRVTSSDAEIIWFLSDKDDVLMTAPVGTEMHVISTEGDKYRHLPTNWYWVLLPRDGWGTQRAGWISGRLVDWTPGEPPKAAPPPEPTMILRQPEPVEAPPPPPPAPVEPPAPVVEKPAPFEVTINFEFDKSDLTSEAKGVLASAAERLKAAQDVDIALEGHADATGPEQYNEKLGLARAETVKRYLAEQYEISVEKITVVSHGEKEPVASNATKDGRAQNRRVVVKVGAQPQ